MKLDSLTISNIYGIEGYNSHFYNRNTPGGWPRNLYKIFIRLSRLLICPHMETLYLDVTQAFSFIVGMLYRPPNSDEDMFLTSLTDIISSICPSKTCLLDGRFNINILNHTGTNANNLVNLFQS